MHALAIPTALQACSLVPAQLHFSQHTQVFHCSSQTLLAQSKHCNYPLPILGIGLSTSSIMDRGRKPDAVTQGFTLNLVNTSILLRRLSDTSQQTQTTPATRDDQIPRLKPTTEPPHKFTAHLDQILEDTTQTALSPATKAMQDAARTAYLDRVRIVSDRTSLSFLEAATKARMARAARLDRESLEKLEMASRRAEMLVTPPKKKERWQYNSHASPVETEASSSSSSKHVHSMSSGSPSGEEDDEGVDSPSMSKRSAASIVVDQKAKAGEMDVHHQTPASRTARDVEKSAERDADVEALTSWTKKGLSKFLGEPSFRQYALSSRLAKPGDHPRKAQEAAAKPSTSSVVPASPLVKKTKKEVEDYWSDEGLRRFYDREPGTVLYPSPTNLKSTSRSPTAVAASKIPRLARTTEAQKASNRSPHSPTAKTTKQDMEDYWSEEGLQRFYQREDAAPQPSPTSHANSAKSSTGRPWPIAASTPARTAKEQKVQSWLEEDIAEAMNTPNNTPARLEHLKGRSLDQLISDSESA